MWFAETYRDNIGRLAQPAKNLLVSVEGQGTVIGASPGVDCTTICGNNISVGRSVLLTANPNSGWSFTGWGGACSGNSCAVLGRSSATSVTATFAPLPPVAGPLAAAVLPSSRSVKTGVTATAFATIINGGGTTATGCSIFPSGPNPGGFTYQTTDSATNAPTGTANSPVDTPRTRRKASSSLSRPPRHSIRRTCPWASHAPTRVTPR